MNQIRYVIRHPGMLTTPAGLAEALGCRTRQWPPKGRAYRPSLHRDFLFKMPEPQELQEAGDYECLLRAQRVHNFFTANKAVQRQLLSQNLPVPWTATQRNMWSGGSGQFVVRPLRHQQGAHYRVTADPNDFHPGSEYISELFPKEREYRVILVYGEPVVVLRKRVPDGTPQSAAWNHAVGSTFRTVNDVQASQPVRCGALEALKHNPIIRSAHIVGVDLMWKRPNEWRVIEFNSAPSLTIEGNVARVAEFIRGYQH